MLYGSSEFEAAIAGSHTAAVRVEAWLGGMRFASDLPLVSGSVSSGADQFVRRTASLTFADSTDAANQALARTLTTPGVEVKVWRGAVAAGRTWWLPVHWGLVEQPQAGLRDGSVQVSSPDRAARLSYDRFVRPRASQSGLTVGQQLIALVRETLGPSTKFVDLSDDATAVAPVVWERDRNEAVTSLAKAIGCDTYFRADGAWVLRRVSSVVGAPSYRVRAGANLEDASLEADWMSVRNHWVATSDRADGAALIGEDFDDDPESPTYVFGPFGRRTGFYTSSLFTTSAQCKRAAAALRSRSQGSRVQVSFQSLLHPGIESGDRVDVSFKGETYRLVLDSFSFDLFDASMSGSARMATTLPEES